MSNHPHMSAEDIARLPKLPVWARELIQRLGVALDQRDADVAELRAELARLHAAQSGNLDVTTIADPYGNMPYPIGDNPTIEHRLADGGRFTLTLSHDSVEVSNSSASGAAVIVRPMSSNVVLVRRAD